LPPIEKNPQKHRDAAGKTMTASARNSNAIITSKNQEAKINAKIKPKLAK